jgi:GNAT superfamily N-acetyltransferase
MEIRIAGPTMWPQISERVLDLLRELGEESEHLGDFDAARLEAEWRADPDLLKAIVAVDDHGAVVGVATLVESFALYANGRYGILLEMYVSPAHRSSGLGAQLLQHAAAYGRTRKWSRIEVTAPEGRQWGRTVEFYERNGFRHAGPKLKISLREEALQDN